MSRPARRWAALLVVAAFASQACAIGTAGTVARRLTVTETATVVETFSLGSWLRTADFDQGFSLGYRQASYVYPNRTRQEPSQHWSFLWFDLPAGDPLCIAGTLIGAGIEATHPGAGFSLGYVSEAATIGPKVGESVVVKFLFDRGDPTRTFLRVSRNP